MKWTPSSLPRLEICLGPAALPHAVEVSGDMRRGTALHHYLQDVGEGSAVADALAKVPTDWRAAAAAMDVESLPLRDGAAEVAFGLDVTAGAARVLGHGFTREQARAACRPGEMPMVADWVGLGAAHVEVADWKTGQAEHLSHANTNLQLRTYMAAALLAYDVGEVRGALVRVDRDVPHWERTSMDVVDVETHLTQLRQLLARAGEAEEEAASGTLPTLAVGRQCDWCPSRRYCPAQVGHVVQLLGLVPDEGESLSLTPIQAGTAYADVLHAQRVLAQLRSDLEGLARAEPLPLPDGQVLRWVEEERVSVDVERAGPVLRTHYGDAVLAAAVEPPGPPRMSWAGLADALATHHLPTVRELHAQGRLQGRKPTRGGLAKDARRVLEGAGAVTVTKYEAPRLVEPEAPDEPS